MPNTLDIPSQPPKLAALLADPGFQRLKVVSPHEAAMLEDSARNGTPLNVGMPDRSTAPKTATFNKPDMSEISRKAKLSDQAQAILAAGQELQSLYDKRIAPKLKSGEISPMAQGLEYTYQGIARPLGHEPDPDVQNFITKSGQFATMVNSYYSANSGGRGGVQQYEVITEPHIPHPPTGLLELLSGKWDLEKQGQQIPTILNNVRLTEKQRPQESFSGPAPTGPSATAPDDPATAALKAHGLAP